MKKLIPVGGFVNLYGKPKTGKSFAALGLADAVANGSASWMGFDVIRTGPVGYLQIDTPRSAWAMRLNNIKAAGFDLSNIYFADRLIAPYPFNILDPECHKWLKAMTEQVKPILMIIDTLREVHEEDENDSGQMKRVITAIDTACGEGVAKVLVSHSRKDNPMSGENIMDDVRGSSYVPGKMDTVMKLTDRYMMWDGRSVEEGKLKITKDEGTGMILPDGIEDAILQAAKVVIKTMAGQSMAAMARAVAKATGAGEHTCRRRLEALVSGK